MPATETTPTFDLELLATATRVDQDAWDGLVGLAPAKEILERRVLLPLRERPRAEKYGVTPPRAILLFGPPGTGKTSLARALAGQLGWAFLDIDLSAVAVGAARLRRLFLQLVQIPPAVIFFDEFEHLGLRRAGPFTLGSSLTVEFLRGLAAAEAGDERLFICATNHVELLDPALLRPGRFDLVLPIGLPEPGERAALLQRSLARCQTGTVDLNVVAAASVGRTAADIEAACRCAAQAAFERDVEHDRDSCVETADLLRAMDRSHPTLSRAEVAAFEEDVDRFARG